MLKRRSKFWAALLVVVFMASLLPGFNPGTARVAMAAEDPYAGGVWLTGDHHMHTTASDGSESVAYDVDHANEYGLDFIAITNHGGTDNYPKIAAEYQEVVSQRVYNPDLLIFQGFEWNVPAGEHATFMVTPGENELDQVLGFMSLYDQSYNQEANTEAAAVAALVYAEQMDPRPLVLLNHPSRKGKYSIDEIRAYEGAGSVAAGFEGAPGHQANPTRGSYPATEPGSSRTYGGYDKMTAEVGGLWDTLLAEGREWFITANSDFHKHYSAGGDDMWPGEYSKTYVWATDKDYAAVMDSLRNGRSFTVQGDLIDALEFTAATDDQVAVLGDTLAATQGDAVTVTIKVRDPQTENNHEDNPELQQLQLISNAGGTPEITKVFTAGDWEEQGDYLVMEHTFTNVSDDFYVRVRGSNTDEENPAEDPEGEDAWQDLWFYSNPIFITATPASDGSEPVQTIDLLPGWQQLGLDPNLLEPEFVAMLPDGNGALVTIQEGSAVAAVYNDGGTWRLADIFQLAAGAEPDGIAVTGDGKLAVTANEEDQTVTLLDLSRGPGNISVTGIVDVLDLVEDEPNLKKTKKGKVDPEGIAVFSRNGKNYALVALEKSASLLVLDITDPQNVQKVTLLPVGVSGDAADPAEREAEPEGVAVSPDGSLIAAGNEEEGTVSLIPVKDGQNGIAFGPRVDYDPEGSECEIVSFTPDGKKLLVTNSEEKQVLILNISSLNSISTLKSVSVATYGEPTSVAVHPGGGYALVTVADGQNPTVAPGKVLGVSLRDGALGQIFQDFTAGQVPDSIATGRDGKWAVVANEAENSDETDEDDLITGSIAVLNLTGLTPPGAGSFAGAKIAVFADPHYFDPDLLVEEGPAFEEYLARDRKLLAESSAIARAAVDAIKDSDADLVLVPGDLTKDGEMSSHQQFAALLAELEAAGKKVYVINGNHDVNNSGAVKYLGETTEPVANVTPAAFKEIYQEFGYDEALATDPNSLSYVAELVPGLRLIAMDACVYQPEARCEGAFSTETLNWIKQQVAASREEGKLVIGMMHHGLIDHFSVQRQFFPEYIVQDADQVAAELGASGLQVVFTGHFHAQDVVQKQFGSKTLYDIETGSLVTYPSPYRLVEITPDQKLQVSTRNILSIDYDTGGKDFPAYARDYLEQGLNGLIPQVVAGILVKQGVPPDQALEQANEKLATPVAEGLTAKDLLVQAMVGHYQGDETIDPQLMPAIQAMAGSSDALTQMIGVTLLSLGSDPVPADNEVNIDLATGTPGDQWNLTILHTNDTHAHLDDIARRATLIPSVRDSVDNDLLVDAGDVFSGTLYFTQWQGQADLEFMNLLDYDAMGLGNHEFDKGPQTLAEFVYGAQFPIVNANFDFSNDGYLGSYAHDTIGDATAAGGIWPAVIGEVGGEQVGIIGLATEDTAEISSPGEDITINDAYTAAGATVAALEQAGVNKIIVLSHLGWNRDLELAGEVEGIDVIVGGHSHTLPEPDAYPTVVAADATPTMVVQAGENGAYLGRLDVAFDDGGAVVAAAAAGELLAVDENVEEDAEFKILIDGYKNQLEGIQNQVVGETQVLLDGERAHVRNRETNLGNLIADAMLAKARDAGATIAITNGGGIRASIDGGEITLGEVLTVMPYGNTLMVTDLTGAQIKAALENGVSQVNLEDPGSSAGRFPQVAGLRFTWDPAQPVGERIQDVEVANAQGGYTPIDPEATYTVATNNFMYNGGDGYTVFTEGQNPLELGFVDYEVLVEYLEAHSPVNPQVEGRILTSSPSPDGKPFAITGGQLDRTSGIKATINVNRTGAIDHEGEEVVIFQLMAGETPVSIVALQKDIQQPEKLIAYFNKTGNEFWVKTFVFDEFNSDTGSVQNNLAEAQVLE